MAFMNMECPECKKELEYFDSLAFSKIGDYLSELGLHFFLGIVITLIGAACYFRSEAAGIIITLTGFGLFYYSQHHAKTIWQCKSCNKKYVGKKLKPFTGY